MSAAKDYSLLRPFDLDAAKAGEPITWFNTPCAFLGESNNKPNRPDLGKQYRIEHSGGLSYAPTCDLRMAPLCWVEGKPVYKGDVLYWKPQPAAACIVENVMDSGWLAFRASENEPCGVVHPDGLTWTPPKVKRGGWGVIRVRNVSETREEAEAILKQHVGTNSLSDLIDGEPRVVRIEWEEPAGGAS